MAVDGFLHIPFAPQSCSSSIGAPDHGAVACRQTALVCRFDASAKDPSHPHRSPNLKSIKSLHPDSFTGQVHRSTSSKAKVASMTRAFQLPSSSQDGLWRLAGSRWRSMIHIPGHPRIMNSDGCRDTAARTSAPRLEIRRSCAIALYCTSPRQRYDRNDLQ